MRKMVNVKYMEPYLNVLFGLQTKIKKIMLRAIDLMMLYND